MERDFSDDYEEETNNNPTTLKDCCITGCCLTFFIPYIFSMIVVVVFANKVNAFSFNPYNDYHYNDPVDEAYKYGEPDYSDGDLEDKLGDSGYYYDLFPEDREDDDEAENNNSEGQGNSTTTDINNPITAYYNDMSGIGRTSVGNFGAFIQGTSANVAGKVASVGNITPGVYLIDDKIYYFREGNEPYNGWLQVGESWYYFDDYMIRNELKEINGKVYYFEDNGNLAMNKEFIIENIKFSANSNGEVSKIE